jgi:hypothetical protein
MQIISGVALSIKITKKTSLMPDQPLSFRCSKNKTKISLLEHFIIKDY